MTYKEHTETFILEVVVTYDRDNLVWDLECTTGGHRINNIEHVHQLQHALRICGLKKEITL